MDKYTITHHTEETACDWCGTPLDVGDTAWEQAARVYCSRHCAQQALAETEETGAA
jgi:hypothetical protein